MIEIPADTTLLVADWGIGDHYLVGAFADAVRRHYGLKVWLAGREDLAFLGPLYPAVERYIVWPRGEDAQALSTATIERGKVFYAHFPKLELMRAVGYRDFHFLDAYRCRLGLPPTANPTRPRPPNANELAAAGERIRACGAEPGNTIILSTEARTTASDGVEPTFWVALAAQLEALGLHVLVNATAATKVPAGLRRCDVPLPEVRAVVQSAGYCCSVRSGFSDLVCDLRGPQAVVYADIRYWAGPLRDGTTFARYGLTRTPCETVVSPRTVESSLGELVNYFSARRAKLAVAAGR